jgi:hypothetical protein
MTEIPSETHASGFQVIQLGSKIERFHEYLSEEPTIEPVAVDGNKNYQRKVKVHNVAAGLALTFTDCRMNNKGPGK